VGAGPERHGSRSRVSDNVGMKAVLAMGRHSVAGQSIRYGVAGSIVAAVYLGLPLLLNGAMGIAIEIVVPIAYVLAVSLHFNLQRGFVFRHTGAFALTTREQIMRYVGIGAVQYPTTAVLTAVLPGALGVSERVVFVGVTLAISGAGFLLLRVHVFHPDDSAAPAVDQPLTPQEHRPEVELLRRG
jgi:putative flippase GtrA